MKNACTLCFGAPALLLVAFLALAFAGLSGCTQEAEVPTDEPTTELVESTDLMTTGRDLYETYCASCHGPEARGDGPVAALLTVPPPDLTQIRARNGGTFPVDDLYRMVDGREAVAAHGTREMPVWGNAWESVDGGPPDNGMVEQRINLLIEYLRSIQEEPEPESTS